MWNPVPGSSGQFAVPHRPITIATTFDFTDAYGYPDSSAEGNELPLPTELPSSVHTYAFATKVTNALNQNAFTQYDYYLGKPVNGEDPNGIVAKGSYGDALDRPTGVDTGIFTNSLIQHHTSFVYDDTAHTITTHNDQVTLNDEVLTSTMFYDGLGRRTDTQQTEPGGSIIHNVQQYDGMGRVSRTINPYRSPTGETTNGYADTTYDGAGRVLTVTTSDGAVVTTSYSANATTVTDQATRQRRSITDGLGRLSRVDEPNAAGSLGTVASPNQPTTYVYDVLDDLVQVTQGAQIRYFMYDSLKRLIRARNPEQDTNPSLSLSDPLTGNSAWSLKYVYDENSNLLTRTDARGTLGITTAYVYDTLGRVTSRTYTNDPQSTPAVSYKYDNQTLPGGAPTFSVGSSKGRLIAVTYGTGSAGNYTGYDQLGRVNVSYQQTDSVNYGFGYRYNLASEMTSETYPSGRQIITEYDTASRATGIRGAAVYYAGAAASDATNRIQYAPQGAVSVMKLGNGKWEHTNFNNRLQPTQIGLGTSGTDSSIMKVDYGYGTTTNSGNVMSQIITAPSLTVNQCYGYDSLNRLTSAEEKNGGTACAGSQQWKQAFTYDRFGNRNFNLVDTTPNVLGPNQNPTINQSTNRIAAGQNYGYDFAGNLTSDPTTNANGIVFDAENRQTQYTKTGQATNSYYYDGDGHRIKKIDSSGTTVFVYNAGGQLIAEYTAGNPSSGGTSYLTTDHLGSTRRVIKSNGTTTTTTRHDYLPFGEEIQAGIGGRTTGQGYVADGVRQKFTQKERDSESGLDYFLARYYSSILGRFTSPDLLFAGQDDTNPQTWNLYTYTSNNPLNLTDPDGLRWFYKKNDKGKITDVQWVNPNDDGSYTSPGEGYQAFIPTKENPVLEVFSADGRLAYHFGETAGGGPGARSYWTGKTEDATVGLVMDYLVGKAIGTIVGRAVASFASFALRGGAGAAAQNIAGITAKQAAKLAELLERIPGAKQVFAFGSRTTGKSTANSDLDIALIGEINRYDPATIRAVKEAQVYAESIGIGTGKGTMPLDMSVYRSVRELTDAFRANPGFNASRGIPNLLKVR